MDILQFAARVLVIQSDAPGTETRSRRTWGQLRPRHDRPRSGQPIGGLSFPL